MQENPLKSYLMQQLTAAKQQLLTIGPDADIEALHRFRVALRRFRTVLDSYTKEMYAPDAIAKSMLKVTNALRESDVFLAAMDKKKYPKLFAAITQYRLKLYKRHWTKQTVKRFDHTLDALLQDVSAFKLEMGDKKLVKTAEKLFKEAEQAEEALTDKTPEAQVHEVRLMYKQARYALEFLHEAGLADESKRIKRVKKTLEHFGDIQDATNQLDWLESFCEKHPSDECSRLSSEKKKALQDLKALFSP